MPRLQCGAAGGACCLGTNSKGYVQATCGSGLSCIPSSSAPTGSKAQLQRLNTGLAAAVNSPAVAGVCKAFAAADCGKPFMPCGKDAGARLLACRLPCCCAAANTRVLKQMPPCRVWRLPAPTNACHRSWCDLPWRLGSLCGWPLLRVRSGRHCGRALPATAR